MGTFQYRPGRFAPKNIDTGVGFHTIGGVGLAAVKLTNTLQLTQGRSMTTQPIDQAVHRQFVAGADRAGALECGLLGHEYSYGLRDSLKRREKRQGCDLRK